MPNKATFMGSKSCLGQFQFGDIKIPKNSPFIACLMFSCIIDGPSISKKYFPYR